MRPVVFLFGACCLATLSLLPLAAQNSVPGHTRPLADATELTLTSTFLGTNKKLRLQLPPGFASASADHTYPVVLVLEEQFAAMIAGTVHHLALTSRMPEALVVSLVEDGQPFYAPRVYTNGSDFWPKQWEQMPFDQPDDRLLDFFERELFPYLTQHYRAADYRIIVGTSARAVLVLHSFCRRPELFQVHVAVAAGDILGMGYDKGKTFIDHIETRLKQTAAPPTRRGALYVASAQSDVAHTAQIAANLEALATRFTAYQHPWRPLTAKVFADEDHYAVLMPAWLEVLGQVFPRARFSRRYQEFESKAGAVLQHIDQHHADLSREYGFAIMPRARVWNSGNCLFGSGRRLLGAERYAEAAEIFARCAAYQPQSAEAVHQQAEALTAAGRLDAALAARREALARARRYAPDQVALYQRRLEEAQTKPAAGQ